MTAKNTAAGDENKNLEEREITEKPTTDELNDKDAPESSADGEAGADVKAGADAAPKDDAPPSPPPSPALQDMKDAGLLADESDDDSEPEAKPAKKKAKKESRSGAENLAVVARFRWMVLLVLSLTAVAGWTLEAVLSDRPFVLMAWALLTVTLILSLGTIKVLRRPTRAGLAALGWSCAYVITTLHGPIETLYRGLPAAIIWGGLLTLIFLWTGVAIWRKLGRYQVVDVILSLILIYAALGPVVALINSVTSANVMDFSFEALAASPVALTSALDNFWFLWPMSVTVFFVLPLAALFSFCDQLTALRRRGARHGGNLFLTLAFILLLPYAFMVFPAARNDLPHLSAAIVKVYSAGSESNPWLSAPAGDQPPAYAPAPSAKQPAEPVKQSGAAAVSPPPAKAAAPAEKLSEEEAVRATAPPIIQTAPVITPEMEERLLDTEQRLNQALDRINELERQLEKLTAAPAATEKTPAAPAETAPIEKSDDDAAAPAAETLTEGENSAPSQVGQAAETADVAARAESATAPADDESIDFEVLLVTPSAPERPIVIEPEISALEPNSDDGEAAALAAAPAMPFAEDLSAEEAAVGPEAAGPEGSQALPLINDDSFLAAESGFDSPFASDKEQRLSEASKPSLPETTSAPRIGGSTTGATPGPVLPGPDFSTPASVHYLTA